MLTVRSLGESCIRARVLENLGGSDRRMLAERIPLSLS